MISRCIKCNKIMFGSGYCDTCKVRLEIKEIKDTLISVSNSIPKEIINGDKLVFESDGTPVGSHLKIGNINLQGVRYVNITADPTSTNLSSSVFIYDAKVGLESIYLILEKTNTKIENKREIIEQLIKMLKEE